MLDRKYCLHFFLNLNNFVVLQKAEATFVQNITSPLKITPKMDQNKSIEKNITVDNNSTKNSTEKDPQAKNINKTELPANKVKLNSTSTSTKTSSRTYYFPLTITPIITNLDFKPLSKSEVKESHNLLSKFDDFERNKTLHKITLNKFESFIFDSRDKLDSNSDKLLEIIPQNTLDKHMHMLDNLDEWILNNGNASTSEINTRLTDSKKIIDDIFERLHEVYQLPLVVNSSLKLIEDFKYVIQKVWPTERPWVTQNDLNYCLSAINNFEKWLLNASDMQSKQYKYEQPILTSHIITEKLEPIQDIFFSIMSVIPPSNISQENKNSTGNKGDPQKNDEQINADTKTEEINKNNTSTASEEKIDKQTVNTKDQSIHSEEEKPDL